MRSDLSLKICEIFYSLQGESTRAGLPCIFIRLSGCNLDCAWCDTPYARTESTPMTIGEILEKIRPFNCRLVEITGGEPLLQKHTKALTQALLANNYKVLVETNGSLDISVLPEGCVRIIDVKPPSSGHEKSFLTANLKHLSEQDELKFVIADRQDFEFAENFLKSTQVDMDAARIHLSVAWGALSPEVLSEWIIQSNINARLSLQLHKIIWDPDSRGV